MGPIAEMRDQNGTDLGGVGRLGTEAPAAVPHMVPELLVRALWGRLAGKRTPGRHIHPILVERIVDRDLLTGSESRPEGVGPSLVLPRQERVELPIAHVLDGG